MPSTRGIKVFALSTEQGDFVGIEPVPVKFPEVTRVVYVLDNSISMGAASKEFATVASNFQQNMGIKHVVISYDSTARNTSFEALMNQRQGGSTNFGAAAQQMNNNIRAMKEEYQRENETDQLPNVMIIFMTDGQETSGAESRESRFSECKRTIRECCSPDSQMYVIAYTSSASHTVLTHLGQFTHVPGTFKFVTPGGLSIRDSFSEIFEEQQLRSAGIMDIPFPLMVCLGDTRQAEIPFVSKHGDFFNVDDIPSSVVTCFLQGDTWSIPFTHALNLEEFEGDVPMMALATRYRELSMKVGELASTTFSERTSADTELVGLVNREIETLKRNFDDVFDKVLHSSFVKLGDDITKLLATIKTVAIRDLPSSMRMDILAGVKVCGITNRGREKRAENIRLKGALQQNKMLDKVKAIPLPTPDMMVGIPDELQCMITLGNSRDIYDEIIERGHHSPGDLFVLAFQKGADVEEQIDNPDLTNPSSLSGEMRVSLVRFEAMEGIVDGTSNFITLKQSKTGMTNHCSNSVRGFHGDNINACLPLCMPYNTDVAVAMMPQLLGRYVGGSTLAMAKKNCRAASVFLGNLITKGYTSEWGVEAMLSMWKTMTTCTKADVSGFREMQERYSLLNVHSNRVPEFSFSLMGVLCGGLLGDQDLESYDTISKIMMQENLRRTCMMVGGKVHNSSTDAFQKDLAGILDIDKVTESISIDASSLYDLMKDLGGKLVTGKDISSSQGVIREHIDALIESMVTHTTCVSSTVDITMMKDYFTSAINAKTIGDFGRIDIHTICLVKKFLEVIEFYGGVENFAARIGAWPDEELVSQVKNILEDEATRVARLPSKETLMLEMASGVDSSAENFDRACQTTCFNSFKNRNHGDFKEECTKINDADFMENYMTKYIEDQKLGEKLSHRLRTKMTATLIETFMETHDMELASGILRSSCMTYDDVKGMLTVDDSLLRMFQDTITSFVRDMGEDRTDKNGILSKIEMAFEGSYHNGETKITVLPHLEGSAVIPVGKSAKVIIPMFLSYLVEESDSSYNVLKSIVKGNETSHIYRCYYANSECGPCRFDGTWKACSRSNRHGSCMRAPGPLYSLAAQTKWEIENQVY